jgi:starvation-inducible outer membrane lipoprotein
MSGVAFRLGRRQEKAMTRALLLASLALAGCSSTPRLLPAGVSGNEMFVSVSNVWNVSEALPYATEHCQKYGKVPRSTGQEGYTTRFDCLRPD